VDSYQVAQLVSMVEGLPSAVVMATWSQDEQQDWHTDWHEMPRHFGHTDKLTQSLLLVSQGWVSLAEVENLSERA
jgi:hypothetical protein